MIRRPPRSTLSSSSAASDVYKRQGTSISHNKLKVLDRFLSHWHKVVMEPANKMGTDAMATCVFTLLNSKVVDMKMMKVMSLLLSHTSHGPPQVELSTARTQTAKTTTAGDTAVAVETPAGDVAAAAAEGATDGTAAAAEGAAEGAAPSVAEGTAGAAEGTSAASDGTAAEGTAAEGTAAEGTAAEGTAAEGTAAEAVEGITSAVAVERTAAAVGTAEGAASASKSAGAEVAERPASVGTADLVGTATAVAGGADLGTTTLSLIHISEPTRLLSISYAVFCLKKKKKKKR
eukprot:TRINITY_DN6039_c0_g1_i3.p1 TRINITY_DN6039_c0_g1~~TRINITY_DN6039_c0_g1_i3.p1  ORF type:complete len:290 (+),score=76.72 TRINITY_DN6039_c0_g1_i3:69-938(+)